MENTGWSQTPRLHVLFRGIANKAKKGKKSPLGKILILSAFRRRSWLLKIILEGEIFRRGSCTQCWCHCQYVHGKHTVFQQVATDWRLGLAGFWFLAACVLAKCLTNCGTISSVSFCQGRILCPRPHCHGCLHSSIWLGSILQSKQAV